MNERIEMLIEEVDMTPSLFADEIGVQRATISHILSGRNNPSLDVVQKVLQRFPDLNTNWILLGKGEIWKTEKEDEEEEEVLTKSKKGQAASPVKSKQPDLFESESPDKSNISKVVDKSVATANFKAPESNEKLPETVTLKTENKPVSLKKIHKIMVLYSDNTFDIYTPNEAMA